MLAKKKCEKQCKQELDKLISQTRSIIEKFSTQWSKNQSHNKTPLLETAPASLLSKITKRRKLEKVETILKLQIQAAYNLGKLLYLQTKQMYKYKYVLDLKSNFYCRY